MRSLYLSLCLWLLLGCTQHIEPVDEQDVRMQTPFERRNAGAERRIT